MVSPQVILPFALSCRALLTLTRTEPLKAVSYAIDRCLGMQGVSKTASEAAYESFSRSRNFLNDNAGIAVFALDIARKQMLHARLSEREAIETKYAHENACEVKVAQEKATIRWTGAALTVENLTCKFPFKCTRFMHLEFDLADVLRFKVTSNPLNSQLNCENIGASLDVPLLCATAEDFSQTVSHHVGFQNRETCNLSAGLSSATIVRTVGSPWTLHKIECTRGETFRYSFPGFFLMKDDNAIAEFNANVNMNIKNHAIAGLTGFSRELTYPTANVPAFLNDCLALRMDFGSGISFNKLCKRAV